MNLTQGQLDAIISIHKGPKAIELLEDTEYKQVYMLHSGLAGTVLVIFKSSGMGFIENADGSVTSTFRGLDSQGIDESPKSPSAAEFNRWMDSERDKCVAASAAVPLLAKIKAEIDRI
jgi:hypothetical protein